MPYSKGGQSTAGNVVTACHDCNSEKYNRIFNKSILEKIKNEIQKRNDTIKLIGSTKIKLRRTDYIN